MEFWALSRPLCVTVLRCRAVLPSPDAHVTLDTSCTSTSGLKGSQPHFRPYADVVVCCVMLCRVGVRFVNVRNRRSDRHETVTYVIETLCPAVARTNFEVSVQVPIFRNFRTRHRIVTKSLQMHWISCVRVCRG